MTIEERFRSFIAQSNLFSGNDRLLLAVSGGVDSVVLCELCKRAGLQFAIAHCNFQLRGEESERDEKFVLAIGAAYDVKVQLQRFDTEQYAVTRKISIQEAARDLRYEWFAHLIKSGTADFLLTAHHADDNIETLLMHFFRGTGLPGLRGIPAINQYIRRPLLSITKEELLSFAKEQSLQFVEDSSNQSSKYTRNLFRNDILPLIATAFPQVKENLLGNIDRFNSIAEMYSIGIETIRRKLVRPKGKEFHIPIKQLLAYRSKALIYEIISEYGFNEKQVEEVVKLMNADSGKYIQSPSLPYRIIRHRHWLIISPSASADATNIAIDEKDAITMFDGGSIELKHLKNPPATLPADANTALIDSKHVNYPLLLRKCKTGDYFYPLGMQKKKKLARFFIDQRLSKSAKENVWVIESAGRIIWVVGHRIDDRCKIIPSTTNVLQLQVKSLTTGNDRITPICLPDHFNK